MYRYDYPNMMYGFGFGWIFMLIFWGVIIWAIFTLVKYFTEKNGYGYGNRNKDDEAMRILKERYAKGEINKEEFEEKKNVLANRH
ncbi:MAG: hypothetical protein ACD_14C00061G0003 [uncultured bacterium]|nr:MAG: hypothetical protein ACD_14C00061G0003 [uncultured bacterium]